MQVEKINSLWFATDGNECVHVRDEEAEVMQGMSPAQQVGQLLRTPSLSSRERELVQRWSRSKN